MSRLLRFLLALIVLPGLVLTVLAGPGQAHEEREASFPDGSGARPSFLGYDNDRSRVVCQRSSERRIAAMPDGRMKRISRGLLDDCSFRSIQSAINTVKHRKTSVYVLPGTYSERKWAKKPRSEYCSNLATESTDPVVASSYIGSISPTGSGEPGERPEADGLEAEAEEGSDPIALSYADQRRCSGNLNLISVFGDKTPKNDSIGCDSTFCGLQIVGTGAEMTDVTIDNKFQKLNAIRADRAGGIVIKNLTAQQSEFNAIYVLETDGFLLDHVITRGNDEYGILSFASDHGVIQHTNNYYNGDSGIYPGSASDLNGDNTNFEVTAMRSRSATTAATTTRSAIPAQPGTRSTPTTTGSTTTPPASRPTRCFRATPASPRTTRGGVATGSTPTTPTTTPSTSTPVSAPSRSRSAATSTARSARWSRPRSAPASS
ncbi:MAG: right-handed parallel beta-helix repeat-containing protein [Nocardioides sp.]